MIKALMLVEAATFAVASLAHAGVFVSEYRHPAARTAEAVIAVVLVLGVALIWARPTWMRMVAFGTQAIALLGTFVGVFTIIIGVGPQSTADIIYHIAIALVLVWGLILARRAGRVPD